MKKTIALFLSLLLPVLLLVSCGANGGAKEAYDMAREAEPNGYAYAASSADADGGFYAKEMPAETAELYSKKAGYSEEKREADTPSVTDSRKIVKTVELNLETLEFEKTVAEIEAKVKGIGGYIENSHVSGSEINYRGTVQRNASFSLRVPAEKIDAFTDSVSENVNVLSRSDNARDITDTYYDTAARIESLEIQEERLTEMLKDAKELQYMLEVERELANVRYQLESYLSQLKRFDSQVSMSTVSIYLQEVVKYEPVVTQPKSFLERVGNAFAGAWENFVDGLQEFVIEFIWALPGLIVFALVVLVIVLIIRAIVRAHRKKKMKTVQTYSAPSAPSASPSPVSEEKKE